MEGEFKFLGIINLEGGELIVRNNTEVVIQKKFREEILTKLHAGHRAEAAMLQQSKGRFWWPGMREAIRNKYKSCEPCLLHAPSKPDPSYNDLPDDLTLIAPNEVISLDFVDILKRDVLVVKCHSSGFIWARLCKDKTVDTTIRLIKK